MQRILIVAYGNPLRSDDGIAWRAADELSAKFPPGAIEIHRLHQLAPELADTLRGVDLVVFIDAASSETAAIPGTILVEELGGKSEDPSHFSHVLSPKRVLSLAAELYGVRPRAFLVTVIGASFDHGEAFSPEVSNALPELIATVQRIVGECGTKT